VEQKRSAREREQKEEEGHSGSGRGVKKDLTAEQVRRVI
jgi:hypothetical protein